MAGRPKGSTNTAKREDVVAESREIVAEKFFHKNGVGKHISVSAPFPYSPGKDEKPFFAFEVTVTIGEKKESTILPCAAIQTIVNASTSGLDSDKYLAKFSMSQEAHTLRLMEFSDRGFGSYRGIFMVGLPVHYNSVGEANNQSEAWNRNPAAWIAMALELVQDQWRDAKGEDKVIPAKESANIPEPSNGVVLGGLFTVN